MGIQINGTNDTISAADGSLEVSGFTFENKTTAQRNAGVSTATGSVIFNTTSNEAQVYNGTEWNTLSNVPFSATGGTEDTTSRSGYKIHTFTTPGTFEVTSGSGDVEYLVVAGGGGGGADRGGGGGGGGFRTASSFPVTPGSYPVTVGGGGAASSYPGGPGTNGSDSSFGPITSTGGGTGGGQPSPVNGSPGGSGGGGGAGNNNPGTGGTGTVGQGNDGGAGRG